MAKLIENVFRLVNISLVNELATLAKPLGVDIWEAIDAAATKPFGFTRFTPGPGVGGHCLPVDPVFLAWKIRQELGVPFRFVELAADVNRHMPDFVVRRLPGSLADSEGDWRQYLEISTPNGWLIRHNAMTEALTSGRPMCLLHTTKDIDAIRASQQLHVSTGCLVGALYCSPLTSQDGGLRPHNLGAYLMATKPTTRPLVFEVTPDAPIRPKGVDYLHLGAIHLRIYRRYRSFLAPAESDHLGRVLLTGLRAAAPFLDVALSNATGRATATHAFIDQLSAAVPHVPYLGYLYFEVMSEYLMLHSATPHTKTCAQAGELNNWLYKRLAFAAVDGMDQMFDLARFNPRHDRLLQLVEAMEPDLAPGVAEYVRRRLSHLLARTTLDPVQDAASVTFQGADLHSLQQVAPGLIGQMIFREIRYMPRYRQLYHCFEKAKALEAWD